MKAWSAPEIPIQWMDGSTGTALGQVKKKVWMDC